MSFLVQWIYQLSLSLWLGGMVFFSFIMTPALFGSPVVPKPMASELISGIFPRYYMLGYVCGGLLLLMTLIDAGLKRSLPLPRLLIVAAMLGITVYAGEVLLAKTHETKVTLRSLEEESPTRTELQTRFDGLHRQSVILNLVVMGLGAGLSAIVALRLR